MLVISMSDILSEICQQSFQRKDHSQVEEKLRRNRIRDPVLQVKQVHKSQVCVGHQKHNPGQDDQQPHRRQEILRPNQNLQKDRNCEILFRLEHSEGCHSQEIGKEYGKGAILPFLSFVRTRFSLESTLQIIWENKYV